jgi:hypothetical protein
MIKSKIDYTTDVNWTRYSSAEEIISEIDEYIVSLNVCDAAILEKVSNWFYPTGTFQELSISNGWGDEFLELAKKFDTLYEKLSVE